MARFDNAIGAVLDHEGGLVDDPDDPGGITNYGISLRFLIGEGAIGDVDQDGDVDADDIRQMTRAQAIEIYRRQWWERYRYALISSQALAGKVFDLAVNMGAHQAHRLLQRALRSAGHAVEEDGQIGPVTRAAVAAACDGEVLAALRSEAAGFYRVLVAQNRQREKWLKGWLRRAYA